MAEKIYIEITDDLGIRTIVQTHSGQGEPKCLVYATYDPEGPGVTHSILLTPPEAIEVVIGLAKFIKENGLGLGTDT